MYGDPAGVRRAAARVAGWADETRSDVVGAQRAAEVAWVSVRAQRFREQLDDSVAVARRAACELDELERALLAHAAEVQHRLELIAAAERWVRSRAAEAAREVAEAERALRHRLSELASAAASGAVELAEDAVVSAVGAVGGLFGHGDEARAVAERAVDEARERVRRAAQEADRWSGPMGRLRPGELGWLDEARGLGWSP